MANAFDTLNKVDHGVTVSVEYNGTQFCRTYSDGWLEQGNSANGSTTITQNTAIYFIKPFRDTNYTLCGPGFVIASYGRQTATKYTNRFETGSNAQNCGTNGWFACGYGADS